MKTTTTLFDSIRGWYQYKMDCTVFYAYDGKKWLALTNKFSDAGLLELEAPSGAIMWLTKEECEEKFKSRYN